MECLTLTRKLTSVITVLIAALYIAFFSDVKNVIDNWGLRKKVFLVIGILSSPENFENRATIRETWLNLNSDLSVAYFFVVGKHLCNVHPHDRITPYTCEENQLTIPENITPETEFSVLSLKKYGEKKLTSLKKWNAIGFGFQTLRGITIKKLGVISHIFSHMKDVRVKIRSSETSKTLASVTITHDLTSDESHFVMKSIRPLSLEPNMEFQLFIEVVSDYTDLLPSCDVRWNFTPGVINYLQLIRFGDRKPWPFSSDSCSYPTMSYTITDVDMLKNDVLGKEDRRKQWRETVKNISWRLKNESDFYSDITFVDVVDTYRNLPNKLIQFFQRLTDTKLFHYVLKTDDDSFIDVERVYKQLLTLTEETSGNPDSSAGLTSAKLWWWSKYREFWKVQETGKWREDEYRSASYPSFPCGGGYVLSKGVVDYLCNNKMNLRYFQGEDVSMGIWLSALKTVQHLTPVAVSGDVDHSIQERIIKKYGGDENWLVFTNSSERKLVSDTCEWTCDNDRTVDLPQCNRVQLTPAELRDLWDKYALQGFV